MIAFLVIFYIALHLFIGGLSYVKINAALKPGCKYRNSRLCDAECGHSILAIFSTIFWPLVWPIMGGILYGNLEPRADRRHEKQLAEAKHKQELAKINAQTIALKEREAGII